MLPSEQQVLYVFPGQGSQYQGMGSDLCHEYAVARKIYTQASQVLGYDIAELSLTTRKSSSIRPAIRKQLCLPIQLLAWKYSET